MSVPRRSRRGFYWSPCISVIWSNESNGKPYQTMNIFRLLLRVQTNCDFFFIYTSSCSLVCINTFLGATPQVTFETARLSSTQTLGNLLLPSTLVTVISTLLAFALGLSFWPSFAFLTVQQCLAKCDFLKKVTRMIGHFLWSGSGVAVHHLVESIALKWEDDKFVSENSWSLHWIAPKFQSYVRWQCLKDSIIMHWESFIVEADLVISKGLKGWIYFFPILGPQNKDSRALVTSQVLPMACWYIKLCTLLQLGRGHVLVSRVPWLKAVSENGGTPISHPF